MNDGTVLTTQWMELTKVTQKPFRFDAIVRVKCVSEREIALRLKSWNVPVLQRKKRRSP